MEVYIIFLLFVLANSYHMYKAGEKYIPSMGGLAILAGMIISVVVAQLLINLEKLC